MIELPTPRSEGGISVEEALVRRRSIRQYAPRELTLSEVSQLLWSGYGVTSAEGFRTAPSARALYPLEFHLVAGAVAGLASGVYRYVSTEHALQLEREGDVRRQLAATTFNQDFVGQAAVVLVLAGVYERTREAFPDGGRDYVHMDLGHAGQNVHLQAVSLSLGTVVVAAFRHAEVRDVLGLPANETPLYLMPVGHLT